MYVCMYIYMFIYRHVLNIPLKFFSETFAALGICLGCHSLHYLLLSSVLFVLMKCNFITVHLVCCLGRFISIQKLSKHVVKIFCDQCVF